MEKKAIVICSIVGFLGFVSAVLGFAAEAKRVQGSQIKLTPPNICTNPGSPSLGFGIIAAVSLLVAQIIITTTTGCFCCKRVSYESNSKRTLAVICFAISWVTFVNAFLMFLHGAALSAHHRDINKHEDDVCYFLKPGVFAGAAILSIATVVLGIVSYLALDSAKISNNSWGGTASAAAPSQGGIPMGHLQFPPPQYPQPQYPPPQFPQPQYPPPQYPSSNKEPSAPVFVHEDTYMRRQFG